MPVATAGKHFDVSTDNLLGEGETDRHAFKAKVLQQVSDYLLQGFPKDAETMINALSNFYKTSLPLDIERFSLGMDVEVYA